MRVSRKKDPYVAGSPATQNPRIAQPVAAYAIPTAATDFYL